MRTRRAMAMACALVATASVAATVASARSVALASGELHGPETLAVDDDGVAAFARDVDAFATSDEGRLGDLEWSERETVDAEENLRTSADDLARRIKERDRRRDEASARRATEERAAADAHAREEAARAEAKAEDRGQDDATVAPATGPATTRTAAGTQARAGARAGSQARTARQDVDEAASGAPAGDAWASDTSYQEDMVARATSAGSSTDWLLACDTSKARLSALHREDGSWGFVRGWDCDVGRPDEAGRSISLHWPDGTIQRKYTNAGAGDDVNPWMCSVTGDQGGFGIHGGWGHLADYQNGQGPRCTSGGIVTENGPAKWIYDTCPVGTRVLVF